MPLSGYFNTFLKVCKCDVERSMIMLTKYWKFRSKHHEFFEGIIFGVADFAMQTSNGIAVQLLCIAVFIFNFVSDAT